MRRCRGGPVVNGLRTFVLWTWIAVAPGGWNFVCDSLVTQRDESVVTVVEALVQR